MNCVLFMLISLLSVQLIYSEPEPSPSYGVPSILSQQQNNIQGLLQQQPTLQPQQQQQQSGYVQMYRSDSKYMSQMTTAEPNQFNLPIPTSYQAQTTYQPQQQQQPQPQPTYAPTQNGQQQQQTTFEIQPSYGYDLGSIQQQESNSQPQLPIGHDMYGLPSQEKSNHINNQAELSTGESFLHPQSTPYYPIQNNQYIPPSPVSSPQPPPPSPPSIQQELPLAPTSYPSQTIFNSQQIISNDLPPPSPGLNAPPPPPPQSSPSAPTAASAPGSGPSGSSSLYDDNSYQPTAYDSTDGYYPPAKQTVHKHIYVHIPPKEFDEEAPRQHYKVPRAEKHYKIIFIKTPTPPQPQPAIPPIPQNEEKTLIYVLHKKPEEPEDITIPTPEPTQPSKPEVYFIKYKTNNIPALYGAPTAPTQEDASAAAGNSYPPSNDGSQLTEPRNENESGNNGIDVGSSLYNSTLINLHRFF